MDVNAFLSKFILFSECLLEEKTFYDGGGNFAPKETANCKVECFQLAVGIGAPFWSYNTRTKRCHFKVTNSGARPHGLFWSGNTDSSCSHPSGCGSKYNVLLLLIMIIRILTTLCDLVVPYY